MNKLTALSIVASIFISFQSVAEEKPPYDSWIGGFAQYYKADSDKPEPSGGLDSGEGFGGEVGFRFDSEWAMRFELGRLLLDAENGGTSAEDDEGVQLGLDLMYFLENDAAYLFTGIRNQSIEESYRMVGVGLGKHWEVSDNWRLITEIATFYDLGQGYNEYSAKLGLAYIIGNQPAAPAERPDSDGDGVYDSLDRCPNTPPSTAVDSTGCNNDLDGDGVLNAQDQCPRTPKGVVVDSSGCQEVVALDSDNDGVADEDDKCPNTPANQKVNENGCPVLTEREISINLDVLFANNSSEIGDDEVAEIAEFAEFMQNYPNTSAEIQGHTSSVGSEAYNQTLSEARANAVKDKIVEVYNIDASRITAIGYGETRLKFMDDSAEAHRLNRRIEAKITATIEEPEER